MGPRKTDEECTRCDTRLARTNTNPDRLCGHCQTEISSHHPQSLKYKSWVEGGKHRVLRRTRKGRGIRLLDDNGVPLPPELKEQPPSFEGIVCKPLGTLQLDELIKHREKLEARITEANNELRRRLKELSELHDKLHELINEE